MTTTPHPVVHPFVLKTATATFLRASGVDADDFSLHIGEVTLTPATSVGTWTGISGNVVSDQAIATWTAQFGLIQDLEDNGFLRWLLTYEGEKAAVELTLATGADPCTFTVTLSPSTIGGVVGPNPLTGTVSMPIDGRPVFGT